MKPDRLIQWPRVVLWAAAVVSLFLACPGCSMTPPEKAQAAVSIGAEALSAFDEVAAEHYTEHAEEALEEAATFAEWVEAMQPLDRLEDALRGTKAALLVAQAAVNVWKATGDGTSFMHAAACLAAELDVLLEAARSTPLRDKLDKLEAVVAIGAAYAQGICRRGTE